MNRRELINAMKLVKPGIKENSTIEQANLAIFDKHNVISYNSEIAISTPFKSGIEAAIPFNTFLKLLEKMKEEEIDVSTNNELSEIVVNSGTTLAGFVVLAELASIDIGLNSISKWNKLPSDFIEAILFCSFSAATDIGQGVLVALSVSGDTIISCDNRRVTKYKMASKLPKNTEFLLPKKTIDKMIEYSPIEFALTENWVHFKNEGKTIFSCKEMFGDFPNVEPFLESDTDGQKIELPKALIETLSRAELFTTTTATGIKYIEITIDKNQIVCHGQSDDGWIEEVVDYKYKGDKVVVNIDPFMLGQIIKHVKVAEVGENKIIFEGDNFKHVIALFG